MVDTRNVAERRSVAERYPDAHKVDTDVIAAWFMQSNLKAIADLQLALAHEGFELLINTAQVVLTQ